MNAKIVIPILIIITIVIVVFSLTQIETIEKETDLQDLENSIIETIEKETPPQFEETSKIDSMLQQIKEDKIKNDNSKDAWYPNEREWIQSGPFKIDRSEYLLGEKIFVNIDYLPKNVKGEIVFTKIINSTHNYVYTKMQFDGSKPQQNFYVGLNLNPMLGFCTADMMIGDWKLFFSGTNFESLKFKVKNQIVPGVEKRYEPVC